MGVAVRRSWRRTIVAVAVLCAGLSVSSAQAAEKKKAKAAAAPAKKEAAPAVPGEHSQAVQDSFKEFCELWMGKLVERERFNKTQVKWRPGASGVEGEYIGYSTEHTCDLRPPGDSGVPVGKVTYREHVYRKKGASPEAAAASEPEIVEVTEITEIFRCEKGKWIY